jgi:hypothetical protein
MNRLRALVLAALMLPTAACAVDRVAAVQPVGPRPSSVSDLLSVTPTVQPTGPIDVRWCCRCAATGRPLPLYVLNGRVVPAAAMQALGDLDPSRIEKIEMLTNAEAVQLFGPAGANGALVLTVR